MPTYFITGNTNKLLEIQQLIPDVEQLDIDLPEIQEIDGKKIIEAKLIDAMKHKNAGLIVEDTSLYLDCLNGLPGPLIKWFLKTIGLNGLYQMAAKFNNFKAQAKTIIGYTDGSGNIHYFEGIVEGNIVAPKAKSDFGWDPIFQPDGHAKSFAEMTKEEKNEISHRRKAVDKLKDFLQTNHSI